MDQLQEKLLDLELKIGHLKESPGQLMNCLKYSMVFDKEYSSERLENRCSELRDIDRILEAILEDHQDLKDTLAHIQPLVRGNASYFDDLMTSYGITRAEVEANLGEEEERIDAVPDPGEDDGSFELRKDNLTEYGRYNTSEGRNLESPV